MTVSRSARGLRVSRTKGGSIMRVEQRVRNGVVIVEPKGRLTVETESDFVKAIKKLLDAGRIHLVLNLADVPYIDSCGLGAMAHAYTSAWRRGGDLKLLHVRHPNLEVLTVTRLITVFEVF